MAKTSTQPASDLAYLCRALKAPSLARAIDRQHWSSRQQLASAVFEWIEAFYNPTRRHSSNGMLSPVDYEKTHAA